MKNPAFRAVSSLILFVLCLALTLPFVTGLADFTSLGTKTPADTLPPAESTADPYDPYGPGGIYDTGSQGQTEPGPDTSADITVPPETQSPDTDPAVSTGADTRDPVTAPVTEPVTEPITEAPTEPVTTAAQTEPLSDKTYPYVPVDKSYFDDALFIGDSRTVGLMSSGYCANLFDNALFFCGESWSCIYAMNTQAKFFTARQFSGEGLENKTGDFPMIYYGIQSNWVNKPFGRMSLESLLKTQRFGKIYIMFGINEIGGSVTGVVNNIARMLTMCRTLQPEAIIYLEGNLLMTAEAAAGNKYGGNEKLLDINRGIANLADWQQIFYIDINDLMGDGKGNASTEYSNGSHPYIKHYKTWANWLYTKGVQKQ